MPNIAVAKGDLLTLRMVIHDKFIEYRDCPANRQAVTQAVVRPQMKAMAKLLKKINHALAKSYGHNCNADLYPLGLEAIDV